MNELNEKAINMCQVMIGFKPGVSDGDIDTAISTVTSLPMFAGLDKIELKKSLLSIYNVKVDTYQILEGRDARIPWLKEFRLNVVRNGSSGPVTINTWPNRSILPPRLSSNWMI